MIVPMKKISLIVMGDKKAEALQTLRGLGTVHIEISEGSGKKLEELKEKISLLESAVFCVSEKKNAAEAKDADVEESLRIAKEVLALSEEKKSCLAECVTLTAELDRISSWGSIDPTEIEVLAGKGVDLSLYELPRAEYTKLGDSVHTLRLGETKSSVK